MKNKEIRTVRINSRVRPEQKDFIKLYAKKSKLSEGETHRLIIDAFMVANGEKINK